MHLDGIALHQIPHRSNLGVDRISAIPEGCILDCPPEGTWYNFRIRFDLHLYLIYGKFDVSTFEVSTLKEETWNLLFQQFDLKNMLYKHYLLRIQPFPELILIILHRDHFFLGPLANDNNIENTLL